MTATSAHPEQYPKVGDADPAKSELRASQNVRRELELKLEVSENEISAVDWGQEPAL